MAPKKRKDISDNVDNSGGSANAVDAVEQGQAQPPQTPTSSGLSSEIHDDDDFGDTQDRKESDNGTIRKEDDSGPNDNASSASQAHLAADDQAPEYMTSEEIDLEIQILTGQDRILKLRKALIKNKKLQEKSPGPQASIPRASVPRTSIPSDPEAVLRERQEERLRRAGLFPPRAHEARQARPSAPAPTIRHPSVPASPPTLLLNGIDRKIMEIMNITDHPGSETPGDKSELSRLGIKLSGPEKWKGDRSIQVFTDWIQSVAHYFGVYSPMSERLKIQLIGGYLIGDPLDWFWRNVAPNAQHWTAAEVMVALRRQFLVDELSRQAADKFESAEQGSKDIHGFQSYLLKLADQMTEYPSPIALNRRLLKGMKSSLSAAIVANRGIDAELSMWDDIVQAAMDQERAHRYAGTLNKSVPARTDDRKDNNSKPSQPSRPVSSPGFNRFRGPTPSFRPMVPANPAPRAAAPSPMRNTAPPGTRPTGPKPSDQCRSCGAFGHWSTDCPKRLRANMLNLNDEDVQYGNDVEDEDGLEPNVYIFEGDEDAPEDPPEIEDEWHDAPADDDLSNEITEIVNDDKTPLMCNSASFKADLIRESNVSGAKTPLGDSTKASKHRPPLVEPIVATIKINGHDAKALFDSGSTADLISASFVDAHRLQSFKLEHPSPLQLAITGSRGKINRACFAKVTHGSCKDRSRYFDVLNIDRYDVILGTSYQKDFGVLLDVSTNDVVYKIKPAQEIFAHKQGTPTDQRTINMGKSCGKPQLSSFSVAHSKFDKTSKMKDNRIRTVVDARQRNDNIVKDVTPFPDQDVIRRDVARAKYRSKVDQADFFEQIRIIPEDVGKTAFSTPFGTFVSQVAQQGDCNVPSTAQQLMNYLFREIIGRYVHVYLDDIFVFSDTMEDHEDHLDNVFRILRKAQLYLSKDKIDLYSKSMVCLGHVIDDDGLHADDDKLSEIMAWKEMTTVKEVQRFLGLVQYLAQFFPNLTTMTAPISKLTHKGQPFEWGPLQADCLAKLHHAAANAPILKPIDPAHNTDPSFVVTDASTSGVGGLYGQGKTWQTMRPAGFHSRKLNAAQMNYRTHEKELLAALEALMKWEDQLLGRPFTIITDHRSLEYLQTQKTLSGRQARWLEYLSRFTYRIQYVAGETNVVADYLSRFWEDPAVPSEPHDFVNADVRLGQDEDEGPPDLYAAAIRRNVAADSDVPVTKPSLPNAIKTAIDIDGAGKDLTPTVQSGYASDTFFRYIWQKPQDHTVHFDVSDDFIWRKQDDGTRSLCIPGGLFKGRRVTELLIDSTHSGLGHLGAHKTLTELRRHFYWPRMVKDVEAFCKSCGTCAVTKTSPTAPSGKLHTIRVPDSPWKGFALDFVGPLVLTEDGFDFLLVAICMYSSMVHLIPTTTTVTALQSARLIYDCVYRFHGLPDSIISDQDTRWKSTFWTELHRLQGTDLRFSTAYHPQTDGATERANRTAIQILRSMVTADQKDWKDRLTATELAMNSQVSNTTGFSPFEMLYGFNPTMIKVPDSLSRTSPFKGVKQYHEQIKLNMMSAHDSIITARTRQTTQANKRRSATPPYEEGELVYLSTKNLKLPSGRASKLLPRYLGPYKIVRCLTEIDAFTLELPKELTERRIHPTFHSSLLKPHVPNDDKLFPGRDPRAFYDFGAKEDEEWSVDDILGHRWLSAKLQLLVLWSTGETTWEPLDECNRLEVLDKYLELHGVSAPDLLPQGHHPRKLVRS
ncbi:unnamed protein product [Tilletia controversa]